MVLPITEVIARNGLTSVYGLGGRPDLAIKYQADCSLYERIHPLLMDFGLMNELRNEGLVPNVYMVSAPTTFVASTMGSVKLNLSPEDAEKCAESPHRAVRFMVMERVPMSLFGYVDTFPNKVVPFEEAIRIVRNTIDGIERMHTRGIIHGDIHPGNVVMMNQEISQIAFIDFGMGFFAESLVAKPAISHEPLSRVHCYLSHYNLAGYRFSYRDDVYKAVMLLAYLLNGESFMRYCVMLQDYPEAMLQFKRDDFVFLLPGEADRIEALPILQDEKDLVRSCLRNILRLVRDIEPVDAIPRYGDIVAELVRIELIVHPKY
jgi:serine/threonine protein kinase